MKGKLVWFGLFVLAVGLTYGGLNIAGAAVPGGVSGDVTVENTPTNPVPVSGAVTVADTPSVKIDPTGNSVSVAPPSPITGGGEATELGSDGTHNATESGFNVTASAIDVHMSSNVSVIRITDNGHAVFADFGPGEFGNATVQLALTRPI